MLRIWIFLDLTVSAWRHYFTDDRSAATDDDRNRMAIDPRFAWSIAGIHAEFADEMSQWKTLEDYEKGG